MRKPIKPAIFAILLIFLSISAFSLAFNGYAKELVRDTAKADTLAVEVTDTIPVVREPRLCAVSMGSAQKGKGSLITGYAYHLSELLLKSCGFDPRVQLSFKSVSSLIAELRSGKLDMICIPAGSIPTISKEFLTANADDNCRWIIRSTQPELRDAAEQWIENYNGSEVRDSLNQCFMKCYPAKWAKDDSSKRYSFISPYDSLFKVCAAETGMDWRMLAAVIFRESRFHIEARSKMGAEGLSQMIPKAASKFGVEDSFNPEMSIRGGAQLLAYLTDRYSKASQRDRLYIALAAYNGGPGLVQGAMKATSARGANPYVWENLKSSSNVAAGYVNRIMSTYYDFCRIFPE